MARAAYSAHVLPALTSWGSRRWLLFAIVLPALALRALVPAGFMPMRDEQGRLAVMLCPGEVTISGLTSSVDPHVHHHHHHPGSAGGAHDASHPGHTICPFTLSAGPALAYSVDIQAVPPQRVDFAASTRHVNPLIDTILRAQTARGPPHLNRI
jgi:hypothetical protein